VSGDLQPPSGLPAPTSAELPDGITIQLLPLAEEVCRRYREEFPDEEQRYGDAGIAWCVHDNQHLLNWAVLELSGHADLAREVTWLAGVLQARDFPLDRLARNLEVGATVAQERVAAPTGQDLATTLTKASAMVRSRGDFAP
jgi:hypothetical protein